MASPLACDASRPAENMRMLRHAVKVARPGTGEIARAIESCTFDITERGFTMLIGTCQRSGRCKKAMEIFEAMTGPEMATRGILPNFYTYSSLISVCCCAGACSRALQVFESMREDTQLHGTTEADADVYKRLLCACHKDGRMMDVKMLYESLVENRLPADPELMVCAMEAFAELAEWDRAVCIMDKLHECGTQIPPRSYSRCLAACASHGDLSKTVEVFLSMQLMGVDPSPADCHHVIRAAAAERDVDTCLGLLEEMHKGGIEVSPATYTCLSPLLTQEHGKEWEQARSKVKTNKRGLTFPTRLQPCRTVESWSMPWTQVERA